MLATKKSIVIVCNNMTAILKINIEIKMQTFNMTNNGSTIKLTIKQ